MLCSLLNSQNYFWNEYFNLPFLDICRTQFPLLTSFVSSWYRKAEIVLWMSLRNKKMMKGFIKQPVIKQSSTFLRVSFLAGENFKKLIEIFRQEVSNVIFTFLDHWNRIFSLSTNYGGRHKFELYNISIIVLLTNNLTNIFREISKIRMKLWMAYTYNVKVLEKPEKMGRRWTHFYGHVSSISFIFAETFSLVPTLASCCANTMIQGVTQI